MLGRLARELPTDGFVYEPKWDGFRCLAFRDGADVDLRSRHDRPLGRYFPELCEALLALEEWRFVLDGEIVVLRDGRFDFTALMERIHPAASRVELLRNETPALFIAFDLIARGDEDLSGAPFARRRQALEDLLGAASPSLRLTPLTKSAAEAATWLDRHQGSGIDGVMAKRPDLPYLPGKRAMVKVKPEQTADCVVAGFRVFGEPPVVASLLLGLYDTEGRLEHVGVASAFSEARRAELVDELAPHIVALEDHPWKEGFLLGGGATGRLAGAAGRWDTGMALDWVPLAPRLVCEVAYDQHDGHRFRHAARFKRWRPEREPASCTTDQLETPEHAAEEALSS
jgi:ATP-dependent DNA ligase